MRQPWMKIHVEVFGASVKIKPEGKRQRTVMLPRSLAAEVSELLAVGRQEELSALLGAIWTGAVKSAAGLYWYPPETNPDIPDAELSN
jgi:hypothetical protein